MESVAVADVPVCPLTVGGGDATLTDVLGTHCVALQLLNVGCHDLLTDVVLSSGVVHMEASAVDWFELFVFHVPILDRIGRKVKGSTLKRT